MALPTLYTAEKVAEALHVSTRTLREILKTRPYYRLVGSRKVFTDADVKALVESLSCPSSSSQADTAAQTTTSAARSEASQWTKLQELLTAKGQKKSGSNEKRRSSTVVSMDFGKPRHS